MTVVIVLILSLALFWIFGPKDLAINMTILYAGFCLVELCNKIFTGGTITDKFRDWASKAQKWKVWLIAGLFTALGIFLTLHLIYDF